MKTRNDYEALRTPENIESLAYSINPNPARGSLEITFTAKPDQKTRDALKALGFRWHRARALWYGYASREAVENALSGCEADQAQPIREQSKKPAEKPAEIDLSGLDKLSGKLYGADLAKQIREELKKRGAKGCTVRASKATHTDSITITVKATPADFRSVAEMVARFGWLPLFRASERGVNVGGEWRWNISEGSCPEWLEEYYKNCIKYAAHNSYSHMITEERAPEFTAAFREKLEAIYRIANAWNWDNSDSMTDYFDIGYFCDIVIKCEEFEPRREMTPEEAQQVEADKAEEQRKQEEYFRQMEQEHKEAEEAARKAQEQAEKDRKTITESAVIEELETPVYYDGLHMGSGKQADIDELRESIEDRKAPSAVAQVVRVVHMSETAYNAFCHMFMYDFDFLSKMGGTATNDDRVTEENFGRLNKAQRDSVLWFSCRCVAVSVGGEIRLIIDPQGYNYSRYVMLPGEDFRQVEEPQNPEGVKPFYIPAPVSDQIESVKVGEIVTIFHEDGWLLNLIHRYSGMVLAVEPGNYAQYSGYYVTLSNGHKTARVFIRDGKKLLAFSGVLPGIPSELKERRIDSRTAEIFNADVVLPSVAEYFSEKGFRLLVDTVQR